MGFRGSAGRLGLQRGGPCRAVCSPAVLVTQHTRVTEGTEAHGSAAESRMVVSAVRSTTSQPRHTEMPSGASSLKGAG